VCWAEQPCRCVTARVSAGQAVVQFAYGKLDKQDYAVKFFLSRKAFEAEEALYRHTTLGQFLPQVVASCPDSPAGGGIRDPWGRALPACMVMERGEALDIWMDRAQPDKYMAFSVRSSPAAQAPGTINIFIARAQLVFCVSNRHVLFLRPMPSHHAWKAQHGLCSMRGADWGWAAVQMIANMAERVCDLHAKGWVHRDLKPGNIMWLPRTNRWTVIDFGSAAPCGVPAPLSFTLAYAAPEVAIALAEGRSDIVSDCSTDAWSVGVIAFELLSGRSAFRMIQGKQEVRSSSCSVVPPPPYPFRTVLSEHSCTLHLPLHNGPQLLLGALRWCSVPGRQWKRLMWCR
jgi:hypothetical protein